MASRLNSPASQTCARGSTGNPLSKRAGKPARATDISRCALRRTLGSSRNGHRSRCPPFRFGRGLDESSRRLRSARPARPPTSCASSTRSRSTGSSGRWSSPGLENAVDLAELAMEETGFGVLEDKVVKNYIATEFLYDYLKDKKSVGVIDEDRERAIQYVAEPIGVVLALLPITNPTSTALFKSIVGAKTRNAMIIRPSARAARCAMRAVEILQEAGESAGLPRRRSAGDPRPDARRLAVPLPPPRGRPHLDDRWPQGRRRGQCRGQAVPQRRPRQRAGLPPPQRRRAHGRRRHAHLQDVRRLGHLPGRADVRHRRRDLRRDRSPSSSAWARGCSSAEETAALAARRSTADGRVEIRGARPVVRQPRRAGRHRGRRGRTKVLLAPLPSRPRRARRASAHRARS